MLPDQKGLVGLAIEVLKDRQATLKDNLSYLRLRDDTPANRKLIQTNADLLAAIEKELARRLARCIDTPEE